jgi:hypothetical protein
MANERTNGSSRTIGYIVGGVILLLILAWLFGLFGGDDVAEVEDGAAATTEGATTGEAAEEAAD